MLKGWIAAQPEDKALLEELGIQLGDYDTQHGYFPECRVPVESLPRLKRHYGRFFWGLRQVPMLKEQQMDLTCEKEKVCSS